jgi:mRNA-degrading endonuclease RelE of RelBE toxin-antitoxin system
MIAFSDHFLKEAKRLGKKYQQIKSDIQQAVEEIESRNDLGTYLGFNLYKKRVKNSSIPTGKNGGFRIIIYQLVQDKAVLISIYSKTEQTAISDDELIALLSEHFK